MSAPRKCPEPCVDGFYPWAQRASGQKRDVMAFLDQAMTDRKERIEMLRCGRRSDKNFHVIPPTENVKRERPSRLESGPSGSGRKIEGALLCFSFKQLKNGYE
jgi:hypothetical protein